MDIEAEVAVIGTETQIPWQIKLKEELTRAKGNYQYHIEQILVKYASQLAQLSDAQIKVLVDNWVGLVTYNEIQKAVEYGRNNISRLVYENKALTIKTISRMQNDPLGRAALQLLGNEKGKIPIKDRNRIKYVPTRQIAKNPVLTRKLIDLNAPEKGVLPPNEQGKRQEQVIPDYYRLERIEPDDKLEDCVWLTFVHASENRFKRDAHLKKLRIRKDSIPGIVQQLMGYMN